MNPYPDADPGSGAKSIHKNINVLKQGCGSGSEFDPDSIRSVDPDPGGQQLPQKIEKNKEISCSEVLDVLF